MQQYTCTYKCSLCPLYSSARKEIWDIYTEYSWTLNLLNFFNGIIHLPFLELSLIIFREIKMRTWCQQQYRVWSDFTIRVKIILLLRGIRCCTFHSLSRIDSLRTKPTIFTIKFWFICCWGINLHQIIFSRNSNFPQNIHCSL